MLSVYSDTISNHAYSKPNSFGSVADNGIQTGDTNRKTLEIPPAQKLQTQNDPMNLSGSGLPAREKNKRKRSPVNARGNRKPSQEHRFRTGASPR